VVSFQSCALHRVLHSFPTRRSSDLRPLTAHFAETRSPISDVDVFAIGLRLPAAQISERVTRRVDEQFDRGLLTEIRTLLARGIRSEEHTSELQSRFDLVCRLLLEKK